MESTTTTSESAKSHNSGWLIGIVAVIIGAAIGAAAGNMMTNSKMKSEPTAMTANTKTDTGMLATTDTKAADLRVLLNALEREHVDLASTAVRNGFDGDPDFKASADQLDTNSQDIAAAVGSVYGKETQEKFLEIWRSHIGFFVDYTVAAKKGDKVGMQTAVTNLGGYVDAISDFFSGANPNLPRAAVHDLVSKHVMLLKSAVDSYGSGDYAGSYMHQHEANEQIGTIADTLSGAIVKQHPENFN